MGPFTQDLRSYRSQLDRSKSKAIGMYVNARIQTEIHLNEPEIDPNECDHALSQSKPESM